MQILELSKSYIREYYNNNFASAVAVRDGIIFDDDIIKLAFNRGNGNIKHLLRHIENNRIYCKFYDLDNNCYI